MSFRQSVVKRYSWSDNILSIYWHDWVAYINLFIIYWILLFLIAVWYHYSLYVLHTNVAWITFWIIATILYLSFVVHFLDIYLDCIMIQESWIVLFRWDWILSNRSESIPWDSLDSVFEQQKGIIDIVFGKGDLKIKRQEEVYVFNNVHNPSVIRNDILKRKEEFLSWHDEHWHDGDHGHGHDDDHDHWHDENDKFDILVETLGEVVLDYIKKSKK